MNPILINIDVCGICNESCNYCPRSASYPNKKEYMSIELFSKFINDCKDYSGTICFTGRGENSLHPNFKELVEILHSNSRKYKTRILTNGYKLKEKFKWFDMFDSLIINSYMRVNIRWKQGKTYAPCHTQVLGSKYETRRVG